MTGNQVTNSMGVQMLSRMNSPQVTMKTDKADFQSFMSNSQKKLDSAEVKASDAKTVSKKNETVKIEKPEEPEKIVKNEKTEKVENVKEERQPMDEEIDSVKETVAEIKEEVEKILNVTEEQLMNALENLGLDVMALLVPENITDVAIEVTGEEDTISLVTNEELYSAVTELTEKVTETVEKLSQELNVDASEFTEAVKEVASDNKAAEVPIEEHVTDEKPIELLQKPRQEKNLVKTENTLEDKIEIVNNEPEKAVTRNFSMQAKTGEETKEELATSERETPLKEETTEIKETPFSFVQNLVQKTQEALNTAPETAVSYTETQAKEIMEQMTESIKVTINAETTEVNLRLHPESLGNVNVRIQAGTEGTITAQFSAENEAVKAVLESQAMVLKEALEAKGMTIEAVEVMVGNREFDEDLSERGEKSGQQGSKKSSHRRLDLNAISEVDELSAEDTLQREMMIQNGNTIDYTA